MRMTRSYGVAIAGLFYDDFHADMPDASAQTFGYLIRYHRLILSYDEDWWRMPLLIGLSYDAIISTLIDRFSQQHEARGIVSRHHHIRTARPLHGQLTSTPLSEPPNS